VCRPPRGRQPNPPNDPQCEALTACAKTARHRPAARLAQRRLHGELAEAAVFRDRFSDWLTRLGADGLAPTLDNICAR
jgi:mannitol 2-dehydrogenase